LEVYFLQATSDFQDYRVLLDSMGGQEALDLTARLDFQVKREIEVFLDLQRRKETVDKREIVEMMDSLDNWVQSDQKEIVEGTACQDQLDFQELKVLVERGEILDQLVFLANRVRIPNSHFLNFAINFCIRQDPPVFLVLQAQRVRQVEWDHQEQADILDQQVKKVIAVSTVRGELLDFQDRQVQKEIKGNHVRSWVTICQEFCWYDTVRVRWFLTVLRVKLNSGTDTASSTSKETKRLIIKTWVSPVRTAQAHYCSIL
jgi:hypothetical protein